MSWHGSFFFLFTIAYKVELIFRRFRLKFASKFWYIEPVRSNCRCTDRSRVFHFVALEPRWFPPRSLSPENRNSPAKGERFAENKALHRAHLSSQETTERGHQCHPCLGRRNSTGEGGQNQHNARYHLLAAAEDAEPSASSSLGSASGTLRLAVGVAWSWTLASWG